MYYIVFAQVLLTSACHVLAVADAIEENPAAPPIDDNTDSNANNLAIDTNNRRCFRIKSETTNVMMLLFHHTTPKCQNVKREIKSQSAHMRTKNKYQLYIPRRYESRLGTRNTNGQLSPDLCQPIKHTAHSGQRTWHYRHNTKGMYSHTNNK